MGTETIEQIELLERLPVQTALHLLSHVYSFYLKQCLIFCQHPHTDLHTSQVIWFANKLWFSRLYVSELNCVSVLFFCGWLFIYTKYTTPVYFWLVTISRDCPIFHKMLLEFDHVCTSEDLRVHFKTPFTAIHIETGYRNAIGCMKVVRYR